MTQRLRFQKGESLGRRQDPEFIDPFSYESSDDARVQLELEHRGVPFTYRWFDGDAPHLKQLIPDYAPEFTLKEYKIVIVVLGGFFGTLPGVLDRTGLAKVLLQTDGWKMAVWFSNELHTLGVGAMMTRDLPELNNPHITGIERMSPYGHPLWMQTRKQYLRGLALLKKIYSTNAGEAANGDSGRVRRQFIRPFTSDTGRFRPGRRSGKPSGE